MHVLLKREVLSRGQRHARGRDALDGGVVREVDEEHGAVERARLAEGLDEEVGLLEGDAHRGEDDRELLVGAAHLRLARDLRGQLGMGQAGRREDGQLLAADEGVQPVDRGDARLDELLRVAAGRRVHRQAVDVHALLGQNLRAAVDRAAEAVEDAGEHILRDAQLHAAPEEADAGVGEVDAGRGLEELDQRVAAVDLQHLAAALFAAGKLDLTQLVEGDALHAADQHQGACDLLYGTIFLRH